VPIGLLARRLLRGHQVGRLAFEERIEPAGDSAERDLGGAFVFLASSAADNLGVSQDVVTVQIIEASLTHKMKNGLTFAERNAGGSRSVTRCRDAALHAATLREDEHRRGTSA
jgi:4-oxalocrotonate tautomerase